MEAMMQGKTWERGTVFTDYKHAWAMVTVTTKRGTEFLTHTDFDCLSFARSIKRIAPKARVTVCAMAADGNNISCVAEWSL